MSANAGGVPVDVCTLCHCDERLYRAISKNHFDDGELTEKVFEGSAGSSYMRLRISSDEEIHKFFSIKWKESFRGFARTTVRAVITHAQDWAMKNTEYRPKQPLGVFPKPKDHSAHAEAQHKITTPISAKLFKQSKDAGDITLF